MTALRKVLILSLCVFLFTGCNTNSDSVVSSTVSPEASASSATERIADEDAAVAFSAEYTQVGEDNVFVYRNQEEIRKIIANGTGIVYFGFPECQWCQRYVVYLNEVAKEVGITKIYYYNIGDDRNENTPFYQDMVAYLGDNLLFDDEGNPRIYVPDISAIVNGEIVGHDNESSVVTEADGTPDDYWTPERVTALKERLTAMLTKVKDTKCSECSLPAPTK